MKRTPFKSKLPPPRQAKVYTGANPGAPAAAFARVAAVEREVVPLPKRDYVRSRVLLDNVRLLDRCQFCWRVTGVMACHSNWAIHGKGRGIKADDNRIAAGCDACHRELDQGKLYTEQEKQTAWFKAHVLTVRLLQRLNLWPANVPVPSLAWPEQWA